MNYEFDRVKLLAEKVRKAMEEIGKKQNYPPDLGGLCGTASLHLHLAAERLGIKGIDICTGPGHVYCMYRHYVVDLTATQFGAKDPVFIVDLLEIPKVMKDKSPGYWKQYGRYHSLQDLNERSTGWKPGSCLSEKDLEIVKKHTGEGPVLDVTKEATV